LGDADEARTHYRHAASLASGRYGSLSSTRSQAELLIERLPTAAPWLVEILRIPPILMYTGHMIDSPGRADRRFPIALAAAAAATLRERFAGLAPMAVYGSAACGADILCLEAMRERGGETHVVLPFPPAEFHRVSVDFAPGGWSERFERVLAAADSLTITSEHRARGSSATFEYANLVLTGMARLRAAGLKTALRGVAIWDEKPASGAGGAASLVDIWRGQGIALELIRLSDVARRAAAVDAPSAPVRAPSGHEAISPDERTPAGFAHEIRAMLFADAVGYSALSEDQTPHFVTEFLGAVAALSARSPAPPEHVETTGDGLYMVFRDVHAAALYALDLNALVTSTDWAARGLPGGLNIRIALHCGPVYCGRNPVTGAALYTGPHTSRTARIEPVTPPGQVYASSAFAAVAAALGIDEFKLQYVGRLPLAKGYGLLGLHHVSRGRTPDAAAGESPAAVSSGPVSAA
jgi:class 3 adenylate cyclase